MNQYNLIDEPWIPIRLRAGGRAELGIRETFARSREIGTLEDSSPLILAGLHRLLLAVLYRALEGPTSLDQARALFRDGLPMERIRTYLDRWYDRFWLFHTRWPFAQIPDFEPGEWRAWTVLAAEANADNAKVLFDHVDVQAPGEISPAAAARWLVATQTFSVSCGKSELAHTKTAPSATGAMVLPLGRNLEDSLLFALTPQNGAVQAMDLPVWEREPESVKVLKTGPRRAVQGLADRYTWRTRSIRLMAEPSGNVRRVAFASGVDAEEGEGRDPMLGYRIVESLGILPVQFRDRGLWRDFDSLLPGPKDEGNSPQVVRHAITLSKGKPDRFPRLTLALGQVNNKAKIEFWRMERFELPEALAGDGDLRTEIRSLLDRAEEAQRALWEGCSRFARNLMSRGERKPDPKDVRNFIEQMTPTPAYWSILEARFHELLLAYRLDRSEFEIRLQWLTSVRAALVESWDQHRKSVAGGDAWTLRALVKAEPPVLQELSALAREIRSLIPKSEKEDT
jgi:CRISPR system Cascade subunit CasA